MQNQQDDNRLDFLAPEPKNEDKNNSQPGFDQPIKKKKWGKKIVLFIALIIFLLTSFLYIKVSASPLGKNINKMSWLQSLKHLVTNDDKKINGENNDQVNILLLGMGGQGHDGAYLTDTIIIASFKPSIKKAALVSIPRDLYVEIDGYGWRKINHANAYGEVNNFPGGGSALAAQTMEQIVGQDVPYYLRIDFSGFKKLIDDLGGIDVYVEQSFTDYQYPDYKHGIQTISFTEGQYHFDGEQALQYARSRHGTNGEGSDFSRSKRQMQIILAVKEKILSAGTLLNPSKLSGLYDNLTKNIDTNIKLWEALRISSLVKGMRKSDIINEVINNGPKGLLTSYISDTGAYVLTTKNGNFSQVHNLFNNLFGHEKNIENKSKIIIYNGTFITGLANSTSDILTKKNYEVLLIGNAPTRDWQTTIIYDLSNQKPDELELMQNILEAQINTDLPFDIQEKILHDNISEQTLKEIDFVVILGTKTE